MLKNSFQKGSVQISTFVGMAIIAAVVVVASTIAVIKYRETANTIEPIAVITPKMSPILIVDEMASWKVYANKEYGFEVKYPENWEAIESTTPGNLYLTYVTFGLSETIQEGGSFGLAIRNQTENEYVAFLKKEGVIVSSSVDIIIGGKKATRYILDGRVDDIVVLGDNFLLTFENGNTAQKSIFDQMLSSVKFTTNNEAER